MAFRRGSELMLVLVLLLACGWERVLADRPRPDVQSGTNESRQMRRHGRDIVESKILCGGSNFDVVQGDTERIRVGLEEWLGHMQSGHWGTWLKKRVEEKDFPEWEQSREETSRQVYDAWILLSYVSAGLERDVLVASFSPSDGKLQAVGRMLSNEEFTELTLDLAVTRYALSYDAATDTVWRKVALKSSGKSLLAGLLQSRYGNVKDPLVLYTSPASVFVRKYYLEHGASSACDRQKEHTHTEQQCADMLEDNENCDCDVRLCITGMCVHGFVKGMCGSTDGWGTWDQFQGFLKGCYSSSGEFTGICRE